MSCIANWLHRWWLWNLHSFTQNCCFCGHSFSIFSLLRILHPKVARWRWGVTEFHQAAVSTLVVSSCRGCRTEASLILNCRLHWNDLTFSTQPSDSPMTCLWWASASLYVVVSRQNFQHCNLSLFPFCSHEWANVIQLFLPSFSKSTRHFCKQHLYILL